MIVGPIVRIKVQSTPLKSEGEGYDPQPILAVEEGVIGPPGLIGRHEGSWLLDTHHAGHPASRAGGRRPLSIGFTEHYERMAGRFGSAPLGCAGENLIVETDRTITPDDLSGIAVLITSDGEVPLGEARVATPCREFTSFLLRRSDVAPREEIASDLEFLDGGTRGFILDLSRVERSHRVRIGDLVGVAG